MMAQLVVLLSLVLCATFFAQSYGHYCDEDFLSYNSKCFRVIKATATFDTAVYVCSTVYSARLLRVENEAEKNVLITLAKSIYNVENNIWVNNTSIGANSSCPALGSYEINDLHNCSEKNSFACEKVQPKSGTAERNDSTQLELRRLRSQMIALRNDVTKLSEVVSDFSAVCKMPAPGSSVALSRNASSSLNLISNMQCAAPPVINRQPEDGALRVDEGQPILLSCHSLGYPKPNVSWLLPGASRQFGPVLSIKYARRNHTGDYKCMANNKVGYVVTTGFKVDVLYKPRIVLPTTIVYSGIGQNVTLSCIIEANPMPVINWFKEKTNHTFESTELRRVNHTSWSSSLTFKVSKPDVDLGRYSCQAHNSHGAAREVVNVQGAAPFDVKIVNAEEIDTNKFKLTFSVVSYSGIQEYRLEFKSGVDSFWLETAIKPTIRNVEGRFTYVESFTFPTVAGTKYQIKLSAKNEFGWGKSNSIFDFDSTYICKNNVVATSKWRYLTSHEFYGKYNVPRDYKCTTVFTAKKSLVIEFLQVQSSQYYEYGLNGKRNTHRDLELVLSSPKKVHNVISTGKFTLDGGSSNLKLFARRGSSSGFKARFRNAE